MLPDDKDPKQKGAGVRSLRASRTSTGSPPTSASLFFGVNVSCARCHDHPLVHDWKQDHFFGMKSFFNRTFDDGGFLGEREVRPGQVQDDQGRGKESPADVPDRQGGRADASVREPNGDEHEAAKSETCSRTPRKTRRRRRRRKFSARKLLVELSLQPDQRDYFARSIVNRIWHRLFGHGLVMPLDQMHSENPPSHPELLDWLARDTAEQRLRPAPPDSRPGAEQGLRPQQPLGVRGAAVGQPVRRGPGSAADADADWRLSLRLATTDPARFQTAKPADDRQGASRTWKPAPADLASVVRAAERGLPDRRRPRRLLFSNSDRIIKEFLADGGDRLVGRLKTVQGRPGDDVDLAVRAVLCRPPLAEESKVLEQYLQQRQDRPVEACRQLVWALLASAEFRFNH